MNNMTAKNLKLSLLIITNILFFSKLSVAQSSDSGCSLYGGPESQTATFNDILQLCNSDNEQTSSDSRLTPEEKREDEELQALKNSYTNDPRIPQFIQTLMKNKLPEAKGKCLKYVKDALKAVGLVKTRPGGINALSAKDTLKCHGFLNLLDFSSQRKKFLKDKDDKFGLREGEFDATKNPPPGAILVYESGIPCKGTKGKTFIRDCGHVEVPFLNSNGIGYQYVSDHLSQRGEPISHKAGVQASATKRMMDALRKARALIATKKNGEPLEARYKLVGIMIKSDSTDPKYQPKCTSPDREEAASDED